MEKNTDNLLPQYAIDSLSDRVYMKLQDCPPKFAPFNNPEVIQACKLIDQNPQLISSVIVDGKRNYPNKGGIVYDYRHYLTSVFIVLYYLHRDESEFQTAVFPQLIENMGSISSQKQFIVSEINKIIEENNLLKRRKETSDKSLRVKVDYTKVPRIEVYHDRHSIDDFQIDIEGSIEKVMLERMYDEEYIYDLDGAEKYILDIFNTAHYITTMILADPHPMMHLRFYIDTTRKIGAAPGAEQNTYGNFFSAMAMAMVVNYLKVCDEKYCAEDALLISKIKKWYNDHIDDKQWDNEARFVFLRNIQPIDVIEKARHNMSYVDFQPIPSLANFGRQVLGAPAPLPTQDNTRTHEDLEIIIEKKVKAAIERYKKENTEEDPLSDINVFKMWDKALADAKAEIEGKIPHFEYDKENEGLSIKYGTGSKVKGGNDSDLQARIDELEKCNRQLKDENEALLQDIEGYKTKEKALNAHQSALFSVAICKELGWNQNDRQKLWPFMNYIWGYSQITCEGALRAAFTQEEADKLANNLNACTPNIAKIIKELPDKLKAQNDERLKAINPNVKKD